jgi:hypothetical protein
MKFLEAFLGFFVISSTQVASAEGFHFWISPKAYYPTQEEVAQMKPKTRVATNLPRGYWVCTAYSSNGNQDGYAGYGMSASDAMYAALYSCGGSNFPAAGCFIPASQNNSSPYCDVSP